jgi:hypothetical protein
MLENSLGYLNLKYSNLYTMSEISDRQQLKHNVGEFITMPRLTIQTLNQRLWRNKKSDTDRQCEGIELRHRQCEGIELRHWQTVWGNRTQTLTTRYKNSDTDQLRELVVADVQPLQTGQQGERLGESFQVVFSDLQNLQLQQSKNRT